MSLSIVDTSVLILSFLFAAYAWLCTIEFGIALVRLRSVGKQSNKSVMRYFTPMWEVTNVFLVFGFTGISVLFNNALPQMSKLVLSSLAVGLVSLLLRACFVLELFYRRPKFGLSPLNILFAISSALVPLSFGAAGLALVIGAPFWQSAAGWSGMLTLLILLIAGSLSFVSALSDQPKHRPAGAIPGLIASLVGGLAFLPALKVAVGPTEQLPLGLLALLFCLGILVHTSSIWHRHPDWDWAHSTVLILLLPLLLAWINRPYFIHGSMTLQQAFGADSYGTLGVIGLAVMAPVTILGLVLLWLGLNQSATPKA